MVFPFSSFAGTLVTFIEDEEVVRAFYPHGTVLSISHDLSTTDGLPNGVRKVRLETKNPDHLPHMLPLTFMAHKYTALVTIPGLPPLCLKCKKTGHVRGECTTDMSGGIGTYACALSARERVVELEAEEEREVVAVAPALSTGRPAAAAPRVVPSINKERSALEEAAAKVVPAPTLTFASPARPLTYTQGSDTNDNFASPSPLTAKQARKQRKRDRRRQEKTKRESDESTGEGYSHLSAAIMPTACERSRSPVTKASRKAGSNSWERRWSTSFCLLP